MHEYVQPKPTAKDTLRRESLTSQSLDNRDSCLTDLPLPITDYESNGPNSLVLPPPLDFGVLDTFLQESNNNEFFDDIESYIMPPPPLDNEFDYISKTNRAVLNEIDRYERIRPYHQDTVNIPMTLNISIRPEMPFHQTNQFIKPQKDTYQSIHSVPLEGVARTSYSIQTQTAEEVPPTLPNSTPPLSNEIVQTDTYCEINVNKPTIDTYESSLNKFTSTNLQTADIYSKTPPPLPKTDPPSIQKLPTLKRSAISENNLLTKSKIPPPLPLTKPPVLPKTKPPVPSKPKNSISKSYDNLVDINQQSSIASNYLENNTNPTNLHAKIRNNSFKRHSVAIPNQQVIDKIISNNNKNVLYFSKLDCVVY